MKIILYTPLDYFFIWVYLLFDQFLHDATVTLIANVIFKKNYFFLPFAFNPSTVIFTGNVHWTNACTEPNEKSILHVSNALEANQWLASEGHNHGTCDGNGTIQQPNKNKSTCATGSTCATSLSMLSMGVVAAFMATMAFWALYYKVCHIYNDFDTSHNHTMFAPY